MNPQGLQSGNRLAAILYDAGCRQVDILLIQEGNFTFSSESSIRFTARTLGYIACVGFTEGRGGGAIFLRAETFQMDPRTKHPYTSHLGGRVVCTEVDTPKGPLRLCSLYVPAEPRLRGAFLRRLKTAKLLTRSMIIGTDANCVPDPNIDVLYPPNSTTVYSNAHAATLEDLLSTVGVRDIFRFLEGNKARMYTRECSTVATRIDRIYGPTNMDSFEWLSLEADATFGRAVFDSDHKALIARIGHISKVDKPPPRPVITKATYSQPQAIAAIRTLHKDIYDTYDPAAYGHAVVHEYFKVSAHQLLLDLSNDNKPKLGTTQLLTKQLKHLTNNPLNEPPSANRKRQIDATTRELQEARQKYKGAHSHKALRKVELEERCAKPFFNKYKPNLRKKPISHLYQMNGTQPTDQLTSSTEEMLQASSGYYEALMCEKPSDLTASKPLLDEISKRPIPKSAANALEGSITVSEARKAIRSMAKGKAPGPDGLHAEFYKIHEHLLITRLTQAYNEMHQEGTLTPSMREGNIILLYKKKDPYDIRNYRPITLLNTDYKILAKILVARMKQVMDEFISLPQTGFVPNRVITENSLLCKLIQAYLDETDEEGLFLFLDLEKAFDRCSHDYLNAAVKAAGLGKDMLRWIETFYNPDMPMYRRTTVNGHTSHYFPIKSGVAQGCPLSPILFLFITEGLTRYILNAPDQQYKGITVGKEEYRLSMFADDTTLLIRNYSYIPYLFDTLLPMYEAATGMKVNISKTEGLRLGRLRRPDSPPPDYLPTGIAWCAEGDYIVSLGVPIGNNFNERTFWLTKYNRCKSLIAHWYEIPSLTILGRAMLANTMILSRFRYWAQCIHMPEDIARAISSDVQALIWGRDPEFDPEELGTELLNRRWIRNQSQYLPTKEGGLSLLHWPSHLHALEGIVWHKYSDSTQAAWKQILDQWVGGRFIHGRGTPFTTIPAAWQLRSLTYRKSSLPKFFRYGLAHLRTLTLTPTTPGRFRSEDEARAEPFWYSHRHTIRNTTHYETWQTKFHLNRLQDMVVFEQPPREWTHQEITSFMNARVMNLDPYALRFFRWQRVLKHKTLASAESLTKQWMSFREDVGPQNIAATYQPQTPLADPRYSRFSRREMRRQGWLGHAGLRPGGIESPIEPQPKPPAPGAPRTGLSYGNPNQPAPASKHTNQYPRITFTMSHSSRPDVTKPEPDPFFRTLHGVVRNEEFGGGVVYGYPLEIDGTEYIQLVSLTRRGSPTATGERKKCYHSRMRRLLYWGSGVSGIAEVTYPHPKGWTYAELDSPIPLDYIKVRDLTRAFRNRFVLPPSCCAGWERSLGMPGIPWHLVYKLHSHPLLTNRDKKNHLRILNRAIRTKLWDNPSMPPFCRICKTGEDRLSHLCRCRVLRKHFEYFCTGCDIPPQLVYLGLDANMRPLQGLYNAIYVILWKFILIAYTRVDVAKEPYSPAHVWTSTFRRLSVRLEAYAAQLKNELQRYESRGGSTPSHVVDHYRKQVTPCATFSDSGELQLTESLLNEMLEAGCYAPPMRHPRTCAPEPTQTFHSYNHTYADHPSPSPNPKASVILSDIGKANKVLRGNIISAKRRRRPPAAA